MTSITPARLTSSTATGGRVLGANSTWLLVLVTIAVIMVVVVSFILSFPSLVELAILSNIDPQIAWGWPIVVDGTIVVATFGTLLLSVRTSRITRAYPWFILVIFGALSIYANGIHAVDGSITDTEAFIVGAVAPLALLTSTHLLVIMLHSPIPAETDEERVKAAKREAARAASARPASPAPVQLAAPDGARIAAPQSPSDADVDTDRDAATARIIAHFETHREWPTGAMIASWLGKSDRTGLRLLAAARARYEQSGEASPDLSEARA